MFIRSNFKRLLAFLLCAAMIFAFVPVFGEANHIHAAESILRDSKEADPEPVSISFTPAKPYEFYQGIDDSELQYFDGSETHSYQGFSYWLESGDKIKIKYSDDSEKEYIYSIKDDFLHWLEDGDPEKDELDCSVSLSDTQAKSEWGEGSHSISVSVHLYQYDKDLKTSVAAKVHKNPVASFDFTPSDPSQYNYFEGDTYSVIPSDGPEYQIYQTPEFREGDILTVHYNDGRGKVLYTYHDYYFVNKNNANDIINAENWGGSEKSVVTMINPQSYDNTWEYGKDNKLLLKYAGISVEIPVHIVKPDIDEIRYIPNTKNGRYEVTESLLYSDWDLGFSDEIGWFELDNMDGDKLITGKNGSEKTYIFNERTNEFVNEKDHNDKFSNDNKNYVSLGSLFFYKEDYLSDTTRKRISVRYHSKITYVDVDIKRSTGQLKDVTDKIVAIPDSNKIKLSDENIIKQARAAFDNLNNGSELLNRAYSHRLDHAENRLDYLKEASQLDDLINELKDTNKLTFKSRKTIEKAKSILSIEIYRDVDYDPKYHSDDEISEASAIIDAAEQAVNSLEDVVDQGDVNEANEKIAAIGEIDKLTLADEDKVTAAKEAYEYMSNASKEKISNDNVNKLEEAAAKIRILHIDRDTSNLRELIKEKDELSKVDLSSNENDIAIFSIFNDKIDSLYDKAYDLPEEIYNKMDLEKNAFIDEITELDNAANSLKWDTIWNIEEEIANTFQDFNHAPSSEESIKNAKKAIDKYNSYSNNLKENLGVMIYQKINKMAFEIAHKIDKPVNPIASGNASVVQKDDASNSNPIHNGDVKTIKEGKVLITSTTAATAAFKKAANTRKVVVPTTIKIAGKTYKITAIQSKAFKGLKTTVVTLSKNITTLKPMAFKDSKVKTLILKTKKLTKNSTKNALKGSKISKIKVKVGSKKENKKYIKKYKKIFTKKNAGRKAKLI